MDEKNIQISFIGMEPTEALKKYTLEKLQKYDNFLKDATNIEIFLKENLYSRGIKEDFRIDINVMLPKSPVRVEVVGENMYANIDEAMDILARRLKRYHDRVGNWEGKEPWKVLEAEAALEALGDEEDDENYAEYIPKIAVRKKIKDMSPMEEAEAIEKMELLGYGQLLFKNKNTGKISMVYRRERGGYGLVEPEDDVLD